MKYGIVWLVMLVPFLVLGEGAFQGTKKVEPLDSKFFDPAKEQKDKNVSVSPRSGKTRAVSGEEAFITKEFNKVCGPKKGNPKEFRKCYQAEREKASKILEGKIDRVEAQQSKPLKNVETLPKEKDEATVPDEWRLE